MGKKPYIELKFSEEQVLELREILSGTVDDSAKQKAHDTLHKFFPQISDEQVKELANLAIHNVNSANNASEFDENSKIYLNTQQAVKDYNAVNHDARIDIPKHIIKSPEHRTYYNQISDALAINYSVSQLPDNEQRAVIAHELSHKGEIEHQGYTVKMYDVDSHVELVSPDLYDVCETSGFSKDEISRALPTKPMLERYIDNISSPIDTYHLYSKLDENEECKAEIDNVHDTILESLKTMNLDNAKDRKLIEISADEGAVKVYGAEDMAKAIANTHKMSMALDGDNPMSTHPSAVERVENIGCEIELSLYHAPEIDCPVTPDIKMYSTNDRDK